MVDPKRLSSFALVGFVLSFLFGLFSGVGFFHIILRAVIFALVFGALSILVSFLEEKFLSIPQDLNLSDGESQARPASAPGGSVNITIDDDTLPDDDEGPRFTVSENRPSLGSEQLRTPPSGGGQSHSGEAAIQKSEAGERGPGRESPSSAPSAAEAVPDTVQKVSVLSESPAPSQENTFQPINLAESSSSSASHTQSGSEELKELSELPDIGSVSADSPVPAGSSEVISDSEFASEGEPVSQAKSFADGSSITTQNASVMAQAIRTILAKEN